MTTKELRTTARALVSVGKGILAADESTSTMERRLKQVNVPPTEENRRQWRQLLFTTPGIGTYLSGVILYDETIRQRSDDETPFVALLGKEGVIPGIKVDKGTKPLAGAPNEVVTEGLDGLLERLHEYRELGARFTKWRAVITIGPGMPTPYSIAVNAHALARYAALSQEAGLVPIVEPEVLMDGSHDIGHCYDATRDTLTIVFDELYRQRVDFEGMLLKPNMVLSGKDAPTRVGPEEVAEATIRCFRHTVPAAVPGIVFLSGGQDDNEATVNLNAMNCRPEPLPWQMSFSYGRGLQSTPLKVWAGDPRNAQRAQQAFLQRLRVTAAARKGAYSPEMERQAG
jgi:fructose-bisphosphate aldolase class I